MIMCLCCLIVQSVKIRYVGQNTCKHIGVFDMKTYDMVLVVHANRKVKVFRINIFRLSVKIRLMNKSNIGPPWPSVGLIFHNSGDSGEMKVVQVRDESQSRHRTDHYRDHVAILASALP